MMEDCSYAVLHHFFLKGLSRAQFYNALFHRQAGFCFYGSLRPPLLRGRFPGHIEGVTGRKRVFRLMGAIRMGSSGGGKFLPIAHNEDEQNNQGQNPGEVDPQGLGETDALSLIGLGKEILISPALFGHAEQQIH